MKKSLISAAGAIVGLAAIAIPAASFAASVVLTNGGLGQVATNQSQFGVAICNGGTAALNQSVPVSVSANGQTMTLSSAGSIGVGVCEYSYAPYSQFNMQAGKTYSAVVTIDPQKTLITNSNNQANYTVTVPGGTSASAGQTAANTADVNAQSGNWFQIFWHWLVNLF